MLIWMPVWQICINANKHNKHNTNNNTKMAALGSHLGSISLQRTHHTNRMVVRITNPASQKPHPGSH